jgi:hypothetical protein
VDRGDQAVAHCLEGVDLRTERRNCRRRYNLAPRGTRWRQELGLPILLAADAIYTLQAFMHLGYYDEAQAWRDWIMRAIAGSPDQIQIMYGVGGERWLPELTVPWLPGYKNSSPVRIGNGAHRQLQLDVFGEVADAMAQARKGGMDDSERGRATRPLVMDYLARTWREPDEGIWEVRAGPSTLSIRKSWPGSHLIARSTPPLRKD